MLRWLAALVSIAILAEPAWAEVDRRRFRDRHCNVEMSVPTDWLPTEQASFPGMLLVAVHERRESRITLAAARVGIDADAGQLAERSRAALEKIGYRTTPARLNPTGAFVLTATTAKDTEQLWQAYRIHAGMLYVVTLAARTRRGRSAALAFGDALRTLSFPSPDVPGPQCSVPTAVPR